MAYESGTFKVNCGAPSFASLAAEPKEAFRRGVIPGVAPSRLDCRKFRQLVIFA
jgi:hypothetical protein